MALSNYIDANYFSGRRDEMRVKNEERNHSDLESTIALLGSITVTALTLFRFRFGFSRQFFPEQS
jgi:hypothetical protein